MPTQQGRDIFYRRAKQEGWRARSAFKLIQLDDVFEVLSGSQYVVDLCAAPGSWSQVLSRRLYLPLLKAGRASEAPKIVAVDLQPISPIEGVICIQGDITTDVTASQVVSHFDGSQADLVVCDGAPDGGEALKGDKGRPLGAVTGLHDLDEWVQAQLLMAALTIALRLLRPGGSFVAKIFKKDRADLLYSQMRLLFEEVHVHKPQSSRVASAEAFIVCKRLSLPPCISSERLVRLLSGKGREFDSLESMLVPFLLCGDLTGYDT